MCISAANAFVWKILSNKFILFVSLCPSFFSSFFYRVAAATRSLTETKRTRRENTHTHTQKRKKNGKRTQQLKQSQKIQCICMCNTCVRGELVKQVFHFCLCLLLFLPSRWYDECFLSFGKCSIVLCCTPSQSIRRAHTITPKNTESRQDCATMCEWKRATNFYSM